MSVLRTPVNLGNLTQDQVDAYNEAFTLFDEEGTGTISTAELGTVMRSLGQNPSEQDLKAMLKSVDVDGDGTVDFPKFLAMMNKRMTVVDKADEILDLFRAFDLHGDGFVRAEEMRMVAQDLGHMLNMDDVNVMIKEADKNRDGKIYYEEFARTMTRK